MLFLCYQHAKKQKSQKPDISGNLNVIYVEC